MTALKMATDRLTGRRLVEVYDDDGKFVAAIYPTHDGSNAVHVVSKHFDKVGVPSEGLIDVPGFLISFERKP